MDVKLMDLDLSRLSSPLMQSLAAWARCHQDRLPCCLRQPGEELPPDIQSLWLEKRVNYISAVAAPKPPRFYARKDPVTGDVTFPFWEDCGKGARRQDMAAVFLAIPVFAIIHSPDLPFCPFPIDRRACARRS